MDDIRRKRGRPKKADSRNSLVKVRLNNDELGMLLDEANYSGDTYSEVMRKALRKYHQMVKK